jgi:hypothetical protein
MRKSDSDSCDYPAAGGLRINPGFGWQSITSSSLLPRPLLYSVTTLYTQKEINMKKTIRILAITLLLVACGSTPVLAGNPGPVPLCYPNPCSVR